MGERATIDQDYLYGAADAIRRKNGTSNAYTPTQFEAAIDAIPTGITPTGTINITENGDVDVTNYATAHVAVSGGGGGATILSGTSEPTAAQGDNGNLYLLYGRDYIDLSGFSVRREYSMTVNCQKNQITFTYSSGTGIGAQAYRQIDLTDVDSISITITSGHHTYNNYQNTSWCPQAIIENTHNPASSWVADYCDPVSGSRITTDDTTVTITADVSSLTGSYWLVFVSSGCDSTVTNVYADGETTVTKAYVKASGAWEDLIGADIGDVGGVTT